MHRAENHSAGTWLLRARGSAAPASPELVRQADSQAQPWSYSTGICIVARSPGDLPAHHKVKSSLHTLHSPSHCSTPVSVTLLIAFFKIKTISRDKEEHYIMIKGSIQEEDITIVNIYAPNIGAPQYIRQNINRLKRRNQQQHNNSKDFNTRFTTFD